MIAVADGDLQVVRMLVEAGADVNATGKDGATALLGAAFYGHQNLVEYLIAVGADVRSATKKDGYSILMLTALKGHADIARILVRAGADVNRSSRTGVTPLIMAAESGEIETLGVFLDKGADVNAAASNGSTALICAIQENFLLSIHELLDHGADPNVTANILVEPYEERLPFTPLCLAVCKGHKFISRILLEAGALQSAKCAKGQTPLQIAREHGHEQLVQLLESAELPSS